MLKISFSDVRAVSPTRHLFSNAKLIESLRLLKTWIRIGGTDNLNSATSLVANLQDRAPIKIADISALKKSDGKRYDSLVLKYSKQIDPAIQRLQGSI
jgi:hypothetical protein